MNPPPTTSMVGCSSRSFLADSRSLTLSHVAIAANGKRRWKWLETARPPIEVNKGQVVRELMKRYRLRTALFAGDDVTDLDAFDALPNGVRVGVRSEEGPSAISSEADIIVDGPEGVRELLAYLIAE